MSKQEDKYELVVASLMSGCSYAESAAQAGISEPTLWRWTKDEKFQQLYQETRRQHLQFVVLEIQQASLVAVRTLTEIMQSSFAPAKVRVQAAQALLQTAFKTCPGETLETSAKQIALPPATEE